MKLFRSLYNPPPRYDDYYYNYSSAPKKAMEFNFDTLFVQPTKEIYYKLAGFIPDLLSALYILILGWIVAHILKFMIGAFLKAIRFDKIAEQTGIQSLLKTDEKTTPTKWFSSLVYWITIFVTWAMALEQLRLRIASNGLNQMIFMLSVAVGAVIILALGMFLSVLVKRIVETVGLKLEMPKAAKYASLMQTVILFFTALLVLAQFGIPPDIIFVVLAITFVTLCLTFILAFGIGGREWAHKILNKLV